METTLEKLERSIEDNLRGHKLSAKQWAWLTLLRDREQDLDLGRAKERIDYDLCDYKTLYPLRNAGLIWTYPEDSYLTTAKNVGISSFGKFLLEAWEQNPKRLMSIEYRLALLKLTKEKMPVKLAKAA